MGTSSSRAAGSKEQRRSTGDRMAEMLRGIRQRTPAASKGAQEGYVLAALRTLSLFQAASAVRWRQLAISCLQQFG